MGRRAEGSDRFGEAAEHMRILHVAWRKKFSTLVDEEMPDHGFRKTYASTMCCCPETAALLAKSTIPAVSEPYSEEIWRTMHTSRRGYWPLGLKLMSLVTSIAARRVVGSRCFNEIM
ncbi:MAG: hypothetical protein R6V19_17765 [Armatimonadota bacterium]